jgi:hypothetical protein
MKQEYKGTFIEKHHLTIKYENEYLMVWEDDQMQDGHDYSEYENLLKQGTDFDVVVHSMIEDFGWWIV